MKNVFVDNIISLLIGLCLLGLTTACSVAVQPVSPPLAVTGSFTLFLQPLPQEARRLTFSLRELVALRVDGSEVPLLLQQSRFLGEELGDVQKRLVSVTLPPGRYQGIALRIDSASLRGEEGEMSLLTPNDRLLAEHAFTINENQSQALFLTLSADRLVTDGAFFTPKFSVWKAERMLSNLKGFVSNSGSQSLTVFNKRTALVTNLIQIGRTPLDVVLDQRRGWLYVALSGEDSIAVVEINNGEILGRVRLRFGDEPTELALTASGDTLVSLNRGSDTVSIIDTASLFERGRIRLTAKPSAIFIGNSESRVYVTHADSSTLSILDLVSPKLLVSRILDDAPRQGVLSVDEQTIYLISDFSADVLVVNAASLATIRKIYVGHGALVIKIDPATGLLYVGKEDGEIAVVDPGSLMAIDTFVLPGPVTDLTIDREENALFALLPQSSALLKVNLVSKQILAQLELSTGSRAVAVMGER